MPARHREVALVGVAPRIAECARGFLVEREQHDARRATIEAMHGIDVAVDGVAHALEQGVVIVGPAAVRGHAARLVDSDAARVAMQDHGGPRCWRKKSICTCSRARLSFGSGTMCVADSVITFANLPATYIASISASVFAKWTLSSVMPWMMSSGRDSFAACVSALVCL